MSRILVIGVLVAVLIWGTREQWTPLLASPSEDTTETTPSRPASRGVPVIVAAVGEARGDTVLQAIGTARAIRSVILFPETAGEIVDFPLGSGVRVSQDSVILRLDSRAEQLAVEVAQTLVEEAEKKLTRARQLRESNVRSRANVEDAEIAFQRARLELSQAREALADRTLRAPFAGLLGIPKVEAGDRVTETTEIVTLDDRSTLLVEFEVAERFISQLGKGLPLSARTPGFQDRLIEGIIDDVDSRIDPVSRTVLVRAAFPNANDDLRPGMSFAVTISLPGPPLPSVPQLAVQWRNGQSYIWQIENGVSRQVDVTIRRRMEDHVLVEGAVETGDLVVIEGVQRLRPDRDVIIAGGGEG